MQLSLRITSVTLGAFGGFVFGGKRIDKKSGKTYVCKANYNLCTRPPRTGEVWSVKGSETAHDEFKTFMILESCSIISIESICSEDLLKWHLKKHHAFRGFGLGDKKIDKLVTDVGTNKLIELLNDGNWLHLSDVINERIAQRLSEKWIYLKNEFETIQFLMENNIPLSVSKKLLRICCINTVERLKNNPYALVSFCDIIPNIWSLVEDIATNLGFNIEDERRLIGMIEINLYTRLNRGHTARSQEAKKPRSQEAKKPRSQEALNSVLLKALKQQSLVEKAIKAALSIKAICFKDVNGNRFYQLTSIGYIEFEVEKSLNTLLNKPTQSNLFEDTNEIVNDFNKEQLDYYLEVWAFITQELSTNISNYIKRIAGLEKAIDGINRVITSQQEQETVLREELKELSKNTTSVQPTVDEINRMLNFKIVPSRDNANNYSLQRENGELALDTLSEGEVTFITFLYFIQLAKGGTTRENVVGDRILVIDDPISSLDSNILFIVSTIIKNIINDVKDGSHIKQLLLFTHNVYFHKEASFQGGRSNGCNKTNYWILRKKNNITNIQAYGQNNPIESSYELLWKEISEPEKLSLTTIQNTMRRILENYFKILGRYSDNDIIEKFTNNEEKQMCKSLLYWINDGSHCIPDDLFIENQDQSMEGYLHIFKKVFEYSGHIAHYNMMMGISQNNTLAAIESV
ncbi:AAA family ATPase [Photobacterium damselae]|uniref:AAA family ATPase n=1 Tax=Photobacterium damselae TaxID=38293 RepID=UPI002158E280|nr:AAA family ATPase [Photobacterium damselae]